MEQPWNLIDRIMTSMTYEECQGIDVTRVATYKPIVYRIWLSRLQELNPVAFAARGRLQVHLAMYGSWYRRMLAHSSLTRAQTTDMFPFSWVLDHFQQRHSSEVALLDHFFLSFFQPHHSHQVMTLSDFQQYRETLPALIRKRRQPLLQGSGATKKVTWTFSMPRGCKRKHVVVGQT